MADSIEQRKPLNPRDVEFVIRYATQKGQRLLAALESNEATSPVGQKRIAHDRIMFIGAMRVALDTLQAFNPLEEL